MRSGYAIIIILGICLVVFAIAQLSSGNLFGKAIAYQLRNNRAEIVLPAGFLTDIKDVTSCNPSIALPLVEQYVGDRKVTQVDKSFRSQGRTITYQKSGKKEIVMDYCSGRDIVKYFCSNELGYSRNKNKLFALRYISTQLKDFGGPELICKARNGQPATLITN